MEELGRVESAMEAYAKRDANALRAECRRLKVTPASSNKTAYLAALRASLLLAGTISKTDVVQSPFHQANPIKERLGDVAGRQDLDVHTTGSASVWWGEMTGAYNDEDNESFNALLHVMTEFSSIDPASFKRHDDKKLWAIWKGITRDYREVYGRFTKSGNNAPFTSFHGGRVDLYYLHLLTTVTKPNLHACVVQTLPDDIMVDSLDIAACIGGRNSKATSTKAGSRADSVVEALHKLVDNEDKAVLTKRQISFFEESIVLKRQKHARSEKEHEAAMRAANVREKKDYVELLATLQRSLREMRRDLGTLLQQGRAIHDCEMIDLENCIAKLTKELESCLHD
ncbi:hypothetical protein DVH05_022181 [Phytophthora capsici]|nr:hypothetical protein DVH05_022181 [Phytophthora capsici]